jgi:hypothetical protein
MAIPSGHQTMSLRISILCLVMLAGPTVASSQECRDWKAIALPSDHPSVQVDVNALGDLLPSQPVNADPEYLGDEIRTLEEAHDLLDRARHPLPLGDITGVWRMASYQMGRTGGYSYPYFAGHIDRTPCGYRFIKTRGSQRRGGVLLPMQENGRALAFLGVATVNGNSSAPYGPANRPMGLPMDPDGPTNSAGRLLRIAPDTLLMIMDAGDDGFELYRLER